MNHIKYYDVESTKTIFTISFYDNKTKKLDIFYLHENPEFKFNKKLLDEYIYSRNKNYKGVINEPENLNTLEANIKLAKLMGLNDSLNINIYKNNNFKSIETINNEPIKLDFSFKTDLDPKFNPEKDYYLMGYNSYNYDNTIMALYFQQTITQKQNGGTNFLFEPTTPLIMRTYNDTLFEDYIDNMPKYLYQKGYDNNGDEIDNSTANNFWNNWEKSGRYIDVAKLNEKQRRVGLKRLLGTLGFQILESTTLNEETMTEEEIYELIAYNISDIVNLELLFENGFYKSNFELKRNLLKTYPQTIYEFDPNKPDFVDKNKVLWNRCTINTTSSNMSAQIVSYGQKLKDIEFVSFNYLGRNVLEDSLTFLEEQFGKDSYPYKTFKHDIYGYYKQFEGKNFNNTDKYIEDYSENKVYTPNEIKKPNTKYNSTFFPYFHKGKNGEPIGSSCYANFSIGGVHGEEINANLFNNEFSEYTEKQNILNQFKEMYTPYELYENRKDWKDYLKAGTRVKDLKEDPDNMDFYRNLIGPEALDSENGRVKTKYAYTSYGKCINEDFSSYYTSILSNMKAFFNEHIGKDLCKEIYKQKEELDVLRKDPKYSEEERKNFNVIREGTKLILNSLTGLADSNFNTPIRMNNNILSMRIIGQLMTWRIGQALAYNGAKIISTNTDGLYSTNIEESLNNKILKEVSDPMDIKIEPESLNLVSRNANIRLEFDDNNKVRKGSGSSLACVKGASVTNKITKPAIIDWALAEYLMYAANNHKFNEEFNKEKGLEILKSSFDKFDNFEILKRYGYITASSESSNTYIIAKDPDKADDDITAYTALPRYNRVFFVKEDNVNLISIHARKITPATKAKRERDGEKLQNSDPIALELLRHYGLGAEYFRKHQNEEAAFKKVSNVSENHHILIENHNLNEINQKELISKLDLNKYNQLLETTFENNWKNKE